MSHSATPDFWKHYRALPADIRRLARKNYQLLCADPKHPDLHFKAVGPNTWSARIGIKYRAIAVKKVPKSFGSELASTTNTNA